VVYLYSN